MSHPGGPPSRLIEYDMQIRQCHRCQDAGYLGDARPVVMDGGRHGGILLVGQAPGAVEHDSGRPFGGRAGAELFRWMATIGIREEEFRDKVYMAAVTRCFPGKAPSGAGDRKPSPAEIALCRTWLEGILEILNPGGLILVGQLAIQSLLRSGSLDHMVGERFEHNGVSIIPLPHPSGASRWLNDHCHRELLSAALGYVRSMWVDLADGS